MSLPIPTFEDPFPLREVPPRSPTAPPQDSIGVRASFYLNIESIQVKRVAGAEEAYIYGYVEVDSPYKIGFAYNRESTNPEMKRVGDLLTLTGPNVKLLANGYTEINIILYDAKHDGRRKKLPFASEVVSFMLGGEDFSYDTDVNLRRSCDISGKWGTVTLNYSILDRSISAHIKIVIIGYDDQEEEDLEVFGTISLEQVVRVTGTIFKLKLFDHPNVTDRVMVSAGGILPLERHVVATPTAVPDNALDDGTPLNPKLYNAPSDYWNPDLPQLVFYVDLWAKNCHDGEVFSIASGVLEFNVKPLDKVRVPKENIIFGNFGRKVLVSFTCLG